MLNRYCKRVEAALAVQALRWWVQWTVGRVCWPGPDGGLMPMENRPDVSGYSSGRTELLRDPGIEGLRTTLAKAIVIEKPVMLLTSSRNT